jgi:chromosome segregation protein
MFLKKVEIAGFKSFANKTTLDFSTGGFEEGKARGITAVVGPNGSGKSNVADAIRWVMGEQSMKNLRGKKAEDIIFAGSGKKARLSSAQATLFFDNHDKRIPLEFSEVAITRKIFRSGESEYLINGSKVRLLDVVDLLAKAGIGRESYCVITQGMSDAILNATPLERKTVLEDAAGVKQYQIKKERALRKLDSTKENLDRLGSLTAEIEPHLRMLKRQAEKAENGKTIAETLKAKQFLLYSYLWHTFQTEKETYSTTKNDLGIKMMNVQREVDKINDELQTESKKQENNENLPKLEQERNELRSKLNVLERDLVMTEGRLELEKERALEKKIVKSIPVDLHYVQEKLTNIRRSQEELIKRVENAEKLEELQDIKEFARAIQQALHDLLEETGKGKVETVEVNPEAEIHEARAKELEEKSALIRTEAEKIKVRTAELDGLIAKEIEAERESRRNFFELERQSRLKQDELGRMKDQFNDAKIELAKVDVREEDLTGQIKEELHLEVKDLKYSGEAVERDSLEREVMKLRVQMEQIGGIDPMVLDEYNETKTRFEFLSKEAEDLNAAILSLREVVKEMEQKIDEVFAEAFEKIDKEFTNYFRIIFGGGNAHLTKVKIKSRKSKAENMEGEGEGEEEAKIESEELEEESDQMGIDIMACPPGKKISHLSMLSGGERSLTSLALLFAIISFNPPPFAVLDEVEAALDEANSRRFGRIIQELSNNTQFVIISHNRETMRQASILYGVTMGDDGISKILSVHLDQVGQGGRIKE